MCRRTALHFASEWGHTETAMALVKAGADVHCKANDGHGSRAASGLLAPVESDDSGLGFKGAWGGGGGGLVD